MPKAYWIAHVTVPDADAYEAYRQANGQALAQFQGRFLVRGGPQDVVEGQMRSRTVVVEFPDIDAARACYNSPDYRAALALRQPVSTADLCIVEGHDGAQPGD